MNRKHSATLHGHRTSFTLEDAFWSELKAIAMTRSIPLAQLICEIDDDRAENSNLSSALRVYVLQWIKGQVSGTSSG
ncbi:ribbon-helix-helix domain-containing protein [Rhizobium sp. CFBP 8762]|uniref:ribbon-helix-helix domain-containing protein n=1 Tax=Rhizobium sp. CFBP 8762 TaxID=2775279 RepID=UPI00178196EA|nr:ribbon-helix-helix domain-containing protein [Rhizobium sp. CFBP 8762]MBD8554792.1 ribbon-helix-helix domain-containing protein [Rhizobium sp. CFBP 8762]